MDSDAGGSEFIIILPKKCENSFSQ